MKLYHGTTQTLGEKIIEERRIKHNVARIFQGSIATTNGYVYVTDLFSSAAFFGNRTAIMEEYREEYIYVFKFEVAEGEILPDLDEINPAINVTAKFYNIDRESITYQETLKYTNCASIARDIIFDNDGVQFIKLPSKLNYREEDSITSEAILNHKNPQYVEPNLYWSK